MKEGVDDEHNCCFSLIQSSKRSYVEILSSGTEEDES